MPKFFNQYYLDLLQITLNKCEAVPLCSKRAQVKVNLMLLFF